MNMKLALFSLLISVRAPAAVTCFSPEGQLSTMVEHVCTRGLDLRAPTEELLHVAVAEYAREILKDKQHLIQGLDLEGAESLAFYQCGAFGTKTTLKVADRTFVVNEGSDLTFVASVSETKIRRYLSIWEVGPKTREVAKASSYNNKVSAIFDLQDKEGENHPIECVSAP